MTPSELISKEVVRQVVENGHTELIAKIHADAATDDYMKNKRGAGKSGWINGLIVYHVKQANAAGKKVRK